MRINNTCCAFIIVPLTEQEPHASNMRLRENHLHTLESKHQTSTLLSRENPFNKELWRLVSLMDIQGICINM